MGVGHVVARAFTWGALMIVYHRPRREDVIHVYHASICARYSHARVSVLDTSYYVSGWDVYPKSDIRGDVPVISSVAANPEGESHNINADTVAGELAAALEAEKLVLLTDTPGILRDRDNPDSLIRQLRLSEARQLIHDGVVAGGMTPKTECCIRALAQGVAAAHIVDGRIPHALLLEVFTDAGIGTMVLGRG